MARLHPKHTLFVQQYVTGPPGIRHNATAAYRIAYPQTSEASARRLGSLLLTRVDVVAAIAQIHREAQAQAMARLKDWKTLAPEAQATVERLMAGEGPTYEVPMADGGVITKTDGVMARVMLDAAKEIIDRAYPKGLKVLMTDPRQELAGILGVDPNALPRTTDV